MGSELLARAGQRLQQLSRKQDLCFRYGGDEFVILMPETSAEDALARSTSLLRTLMDTRFRMKNGLELTVSASVGVPPPRPTAKPCTRLSAPPTTACTT